MNSSWPQSVLNNISMRYILMYMYPEHVKLFKDFKYARKNNSYDWNQIQPTTVAAITKA
jgi:uncharacterized membrane protein